MKAILIFWAIGLTASEKLDRTYLPPPGSIAAGGRPGDLNLPLEFPKENYPSTIEPGEDGIVVGSSRPKFDNVAIGIDRQGPIVSSAESFTTGPVISFSQNTFKVPSTATSHAYTQSTTLSPIGFETIEPVNTQGYPSMTVSFDPNFDYPQQTDTTFVDNNGPGTVRVSGNDEQVSTSIPYNTPNSQGIKHILQQTPSVSQSFPELGVQTPRVDKTSVTANDFSNINYPSTQFRGDSDNVSGASTASTPYRDEYYDGQTSVSYKPDRVGQVGSEIQQYPGYTKKVTSVTSAVVPSSEYASTPKYSSTSDNFSPIYDVRTQPERVQAEADRNAVILNYENILTPEGFAYSFDTSNGIHVDESGTATDGVKAEGSYSYIGDDGKVYSIVYTADENGFLPRGDHLPTAPPIPDAILKVIEQAEINKQLGIIDDGSYDDAKYGHGRYESSIRRRPQVHSNNNNMEKLPANAEDSGRIENSLDNIQKNLDGVYIGDEIGSPYSGDDFYSSGKVPESSGPTDKSGASSYKTVQDINNPGILRGSLEQSTDNSEPMEETSQSFRPDNTANGQQSHRGLPERTDTFKQNNNGFSQKEDEFLPTEQVTITRKGYGQDINQPSHNGYEYNHPQNKFHYNDGDNLRSRFSNSYGQNDETEPEDKEISKGTTVKPFITPNVSFNFNNRKIDDTLNERPKINHPFAASEDRTIYNNNGDSSFIQPETTNFNNNASDNTDNDKTGVSEGEFTRTPYGSSTSDSYQAPYSSKVIDNGQKDYNQPPTLRSQYPSTTPLPSEFSSRFTPSTNKAHNTHTTPTQYSTTFRPSVASEINRPISRIPGNIGRISNVRIPTNRPGYRGSTEILNDRDFKQPTAQAGPQDDLKLRYGSTLRPNIIGSQSTERIVGEDFSGPRQSQRFDPENGYYY